MALSAQNPTDRAQQLLALTDRLADRLADETVKLEAHRPQDLFEGIEETRTLSNLYRFETLKIKGNPSLLEGIAPELKKSLFDATQKFQERLGRYERAVNASKTITEGIITAVADDLNQRQTSNLTYGARGRTQAPGPQSLNYGGIA